MKPNEEQAETHENQISDNQKPGDGTSVKQKIEADGDDASDSDSASIVIDISDCGNKPPDGGWGWWIVVGACLVHVIIGGFGRSSGIVYLQLLERFKQSATTTSWVTSIALALRLVLAPLSSALCNRFSCRTVCAAGSLLTAIGAIVSAFAPSLSFLYLSYGALQGLGRSMAYTPCLIMVGYYFNKRRGLAVGIASSGAGIGTFICPPLVEYLFEGFGYFGAFLLIGALSSNLLVCSALFRPLETQRKIYINDRLQKLQRNKNSISDHNETMLEATSPSDNSLLLENGQAKMVPFSERELAEHDPKATEKVSWFKRKMTQLALQFGCSDRSEPEKKPLLDLSLFKNFAFTMLCLQMLLFRLSVNITFVFLPAYAKENNLTLTEGALLVSILGITDGLSRLIGSSVLDFKRVKPYRLIIYNSIFFMKGVIAIVIPLSRTFWQFGFVSAVYGVLSGVYGSQTSIVIVDVLGVQSLASSFGLVLLFQGVGIFIGPIIGGLCKDYLGSYVISFYVGSVGIFLGAILMAAGNMWLYRQKKQSKDGS